MFKKVLEGSRRFKKAQEGLEMLKKAQEAQAGSIGFKKVQVGSRL